jgi:hypothetical protein
MEEIMCECGVIINKNDKFHNSSSKHRRWINKINKEEKIKCECGVILKNKNKLKHDKICIYPTGLINC